MPRKLTRKPTKHQQQELVTLANALADPVPYAPGKLRGKVAVITGASRGIGLAIAEALAAEGCDLVVTGRDARVFDRWRVGYAVVGRVRLLAKSCDVRDPRSVEALFKAVKQRFPKIDFLINNAGIAHKLAPVDQLPVDTWQDVMATNLNGLFYCVRAALPLIGRGGVIVNNLSISAVMNFPGMAAYDASKHGGLGFTNTLREDLRERGIRVLALLPGATATDIWDQFWPNAPREKMMSPETLAAAVVHALTLPENAAMDEIKLMPAGGTL